MRALLVAMVLAVAGHAAARDARPNPVREAHKQGQSIWYDNLTRKDLSSGRVRRLIQKGGIRGITTNPTIFEKAIAGAKDYDAALLRAARKGATVPQIYETLVVGDVRRAADRLKGVHEESGGADGFVSLEVNPHYANDAAKTIAEGRYLHQQVGRPNVMIKVPATRAGIEAIEQLTADGISVNATLIFSQRVHEKVAEAYIRGLEKLVERGGDPSKVSSVASFFVSRVDGAIDPVFVEKGMPGMAGQVAVANAKLAYNQARAIHGEGRFLALAQRGARPQRVLFASTGTKNKAYPETLYVDSLIGEGTVNTVPDATLKAFMKGGKVSGQAIKSDLAYARQVIDGLPSIGVDLDRVSDKLLEEGLASFTQSYDKLHEAIDGKVVQLRGEELGALAKRVRKDILTSTTAAGSGHPSSSLSSVELLTGLFFGGSFRANLRHPGAKNNDRFILSKGHAAPLLYSIYSAAGRVSEAELKTLRKLGSRLEGHPTHAFPYTEVPTGSLGQGLANGVGMAIAAKMDGLSYRTFVLMGDSEMAEGSVDEAMRLAARNKLDNLVGIIDVNRLGQRGETMYGHDVEQLAREVAAKGWQPILIDGHDLGQVQRAYAKAATVKGKPTMIIARTIKGKGVSFIEDKASWHGKALNQTEYEQALQELGPVDSSIVGRVVRPVVERPAKTAPQPAAPMATYGAPTSVRKAIGQAVARLGRRYPNMVVLDPETGNSTHADLFGAQHPDRYVQGYIAEQATVGTAVGMMRRGKKPFVFGFAAFLSRALDQVRMAQYAEPNLVLVGTHAGVHIGEDGASQMALNDIAQFRDLAADLTKPDRIAVLYPSDAVSAEKLTEQAAKRRGLVYLRATRGDTPVLYKPGTRFPVGGSKTLRSSKQDEVTIVSAGVTLHEALAAADQLAQRGIKARVIDLYSIQPIDQKTLMKAARDTKAIITVEDHRPAGGLGEAVMSALATAEHHVPIHSLAARKTPRSGKPAELLAEQEIDAAAIVKKAGEILGR